MSAKGSLRSLSSKTLMLMLVLVAVASLVTVERWQSQRLQGEVSRLTDSAGLARELSLYVQYNAHDTNAYTLGHLEHREEYREHRDEFLSISGELQTRIDEDHLSSGLRPVLAKIDRFRQEYDRAAQRLFSAADTNRKSFSPDSQAKEDAAWEASDELGDRLDTQSQQLAGLMKNDLQAAQRALDRRNYFAIVLSFGLGIALIFVCVLIQRRTSRAARAQAALASIVENSSDAIYSSAPGATIATWNPGAERLFGYSSEELRGKDLSLLTPPDRVDEMTEILGRVAQGRTVSDHETECLTKDGRRIAVSITVSPVTETGDSVVGISVIARDITERKAAEQALKDAKETAEVANKAKSDFLANMSHEIRTPMNGVIGMTGLLLDTDLDQVQREYVDVVNSSGRNLLMIINEILDFSKVEAGKIEIEDIGFDLRLTVEETLGLHAERASSNGLNLASLIDEDVPMALRGDPGRIRQILTNLLGNAVKFTDEGEVVVNVRLVDETVDMATVRFEVSDTGIGINGEQQSKLFRSFTQADASTTRKYGGTGLGLAISKQLVELMGGEIGVKAGPRAGSTFWFALPLRKQSEPATQPHSAPRIDLRGVRVLIVDPSETNRTIVHQYIRSWGMPAGMAEDGEGAIEMLRSAAHAGEPYDLAILDMNMPQMDGIEVVRRIKDDPSTRLTKLVMLSSIGQRSEVGEEGRAGIEAYLTKPIRQSQLYDVLATLMGTPQPATPRAGASTSLIRADSAKATTRPSARVLVADDNIVNQMVAVAMLEKYGYRADVVADGREAVAAVFSLVPYSAVLMDVHMPEMDGYEATAEIRRREMAETGRRTPIIAMTANAMQGDREKALEAGLDDYVSKPVQPAELETVLKRWIPQSDEDQLLEITLTGLSEKE